MGLFACLGDQKAPLETIEVANEKHISGIHWLALPSLNINFHMKLIWPCKPLKSAKVHYKIIKPTLTTQRQLEQQPARHD